MFPKYMEFIKSVLKRGPSGCDAVAIRANNKSYTYDQIVTSAWNTSNMLCESGLKVEHGTNGFANLNGARIAIFAKPSAEFVAGLFGIWLGGGIAVPLALSHPEEELLYVMNDSEVSMILSTTEHQEHMKSVAAKCSAQYSLIPEVSSIISKSDRIDSSEHDHLFPESKLRAKFADSLTTDESDDSALIIYTSGTTGKPKGVVHTHKGISAQVQMLIEAWDYSSADQFLNCLPLHHVHGLFNAMLAPLYAGSVVEFLPKFSVRGVWQRWSESYPEDGSTVIDAITVFTGVPTMYTWLLQSYEQMDPKSQSSCSYAAHKLRLMMCGSSALPLPVMKHWESITGHRLLERYGMTEFVMALSNPIKGERRGGTVGKPLPHVEVKIIADKENDPNESGIGELCVRSPSLFKEYWKKHEATKESFTDDGFFKTGDTVKLDENDYYIIMGRTNADIMKVGGFKLSALEIESVLLEHAAISECAVLGLPDKDYGETVCAIIVPQVDAMSGNPQELKALLSLEELQAWSKKKLAPYKIPTKLVIWEKLPRNAMGKVNKKDLKKLLQQP